MRLHVRTLHTCMHASCGLPGLAAPIGQLLVSISLPEITPHSAKGGRSLHLPRSQ